MLIKSSYIWAIFRVRGSSRVISVLLSIYIAPGSTAGLLIHTLDFQSNLQSFWTEPLSKELEAESGQGVRWLEPLTLEHLFAIPAEGGPLAQKSASSAALSSFMKDSPRVTCSPSVRRATSQTAGTERKRGHLQIPVAWP